MGGFLQWGSGINRGDGGMIRFLRYIFRSEKWNSRRDIRLQMIHKLEQNKLRDGQDQTTPTPQGATDELQGRSDGREPGCQASNRETLG